MSRARNIANSINRINTASADALTMTIDANENVAIGSASPNSRLRLQKDGTGNYSNMTISNTNSTGAITFGVGGSGTGNYLANNAFLLNQGNSALIFGQNDAERMRINTTGDLAFPSGRGIDFSATSDANSGAGGTYVTESEVLDDYEEGRFTPAFHATNVTWSHNHQYGNYTKVGQIVHFTIYIAVTSATGSTTNQAYVWGLPYTCYDGTTSGRYSPAVTIGSWYNCDIDTHFPTAYIDPNSDIIKLVHQQDASTPTAVTCDDVKNNTYIYLSGSYRV